MPHLIKYISVSVCSNVRGFEEPKCFVDVDTDELLRSMVDYIYAISDEVYRLAKLKWHYVFDLLQDDLSRDEPRKKKAKTDMDEELFKECKAINKILSKFDSYCLQTPVLGFNCSKYDLPLIKEKLASMFDMSDGSFVIKRNNAYLVFAENFLRIMDISNYIAPGCSYRRFLQAYNVSESKSFYPYEWFDRPSKLLQTHLPDYANFYSSLLKCNVSEADGADGKVNYARLQEIWESEKMETMEDFLIHYNNLDVGPMVTAIGRLQKFYFERALDVFKISISLPGIARRMLFDCSIKTKAHFSLFDPKNKDMYQTMKRNTVGGPAIIFTRFNKAGETQIRQSPDHVCQSIIGLDANALYLWAFDQSMPTGSFIRRHSPNFKPILRDKYIMMFHWMDWLSQARGIKIMHKLNSNREKKIGPYYADGFHLETGKVFEYMGCYFHGHNCHLNKNDKDKKDKYERTIKRLDFIKSRNFPVEIMWECEFMEMKKNDKIKQFIADRSPPFYRCHPHAVNETTILDCVRNNTFFGAIECDVHVPPELTDFFSEFCPLFANVEVPFDKIGKTMQAHVEKFDLSKKPRRLLVSGMKGKKMLLIGNLLQWYMSHGLIVTKIHQVIEYTPMKCFSQFVSDVTMARRCGDADESMSIFSDTMKLLGNCAFGSSIMNKEKHVKIKYVKDHFSASMLVNDPRFKKITELADSCFEVESFKRVICMNVPTQIGYFILQYAKLKMLEFHYDCFSKIIPHSCFELMETDTDSLYYALSVKKMEDAIKDEYREEYKSMVYGSCNDQHVPLWFPRKCCDLHSKFDKRTPGLFKKEYEGTEMVALCSKTYIVHNAHDSSKKNSCKGVSRRNLGNNLVDLYKDVLTTEIGQHGENMGFRSIDNHIFTYTQSRCGFTYFYCKRKVLSDGIHTVPLDIVLEP